MNRADLQLLADARVKDAEVLLLAERWAAAYYLLGYAIECALKACASHQFREHEIPDKTVLNQFYTHKVDQLLNISGAKPALEARAKTEPDFEINWNTIRDWDETSRYNHLTTETKARDMHTAVTNPKFGVLPWLKTVW